MLTYPASLVPSPLTTPPDCRVRVPGSKSITNRALILAAHTRQAFHLQDALSSEDTEVMVDCLRRLGWTIQTNGTEIHLQRPESPGRHERIIPVTEADLFVGNSGTTIRFLTAFLATGKGRYRLDGIPRMRERPIQDLLIALQQLGIDARSEAGTGCPPVILETHGWPGGEVQVRSDVSSQFLSGLLMAAPLGQATTAITVPGMLVSEPYITMTLQMMRDFGYQVENSTPGRFVVPGKQELLRQTYQIEPDASSASYFWAAAAVTGGRVIVDGLTAQSLQGDVGFVRALEQMGCEVLHEAGALGIQGRPLRGIRINMNEISDTVMTLASVACFAKGPTHITDVAHIRHKETDRITATVTELRKLGVNVQEHEDGLTIVPSVMHPARLATYNDHRMAMSFAVLGLKVPGLEIENPGCVIKTYPGFWEDWQKLG